VTPGRFLTTGLALAGLFLSKGSALMIVPVAALLSGWRLVAGLPWAVAWGVRESVLTRRAHQAVLVAGLALSLGAFTWLAVWAFFGFRYEAVAADRPLGGHEYVANWPRFLADPGLPMRVIGWARAHRILPEAYLYGFANVLSQSGERVSFLNGVHATTGNALYFPYCVLVKTSPALFIVLGLAGAALVRHGTASGKSWAGAYELVPLLASLATYWLFALASPLNVGLRHLLPVYPVAYVLAGGAVLWLRSAAGEASIRRPANPGIRIALGLCLLGAAAEAVQTWPHYLAYFNFLAGGPRQGYRHLVDSCLDWGQDLPELARQLSEEGQGGNSAPVYLAYFGTALPEYYGIRSTALPAFPWRMPVSVPELTGGTYCISATILQAVYARFHVFRARWGPTQEDHYLRLRDAMERLRECGDDTAAAGALARAVGVPDRGELLAFWEEARFYRLCAALRQRVPDCNAGYSILVYKLSDADVKHALLGPAPYEA
jgi:hypothetical protein